MTRIDLTMEGNGDATRVNRVCRVLNQVIKLRRAFTHHNMRVTDKGLLSAFQGVWEASRPPLFSRTFRIGGPSALAMVW